MKAMILKAVIQVQLNEGGTWTNVQAFPIRYKDGKIDREETEFKTQEGFSVTSDKVRAKLFEMLEATT